ncbi:MAG: hypothetical protein JWM80_2502 [Cyanobacteria bacterium RYN_339]|nr:hypothetical protein [Cyanobacteria bacterium RYN_339]
MPDPLQRAHDELTANADYMKTIANATQRLNDAVSELLDSLPEATRLDLARRLADELQQGTPDP